MFDQNFLSPHVKRSVVIRNKHGKYEVPHDFPNYSRLKILEN